MATQADEIGGWRSALPAGVRPYTEAAPLAALFLGISSGFPYAMIGATLTTRLKQDGIDKSTITAFTLVFLVYNFKSSVGVGRGRRPAAAARPARPARVVDAGGRRRWSSPPSSISRWSIPRRASRAVVTAAILVGLAGASFDIVIDAYRIEILEPRQLGVGSGMSQYGWRIGSAGAGALALVVAARDGLASGLSRLRRAGASGDAHGAGDGRARSATASPREKKGICANRRRDVAAVRRVLPAQGRAARAALHPAPQDRRHAREPHLPAAVRRPRSSPTTRSRFTTSASASGPI